MDILEKKIETFLTAKENNFKVFIITLTYCSLLGYL